MSANMFALAPYRVHPPTIYCARCNEPFQEREDMAHTGPDEFWHLRCFVCSQCFRPLNDKLEYYKFNGRIYCEKDFQTLFAPCCAQCHQFIKGRRIRAMNKSWHPNCFLCDVCQVPLADHGFIKKNDKALCHHCNAFQKTAAKNLHTCCKCKSTIDQPDKELLRLKNETYHAYHFNCHACGIELNSDGRQINSDLYCLKCHDQMGIPICGACRRPIEERVVTALGKHWHVEHFSCSACEKPFLGRKHYEFKGSAYCEQHYYLQFGHKCCTCDQVITGVVVSALDKYYCVDHFACFSCGSKIVVNKAKFFDVGTNPCCKKCYRKLPGSLRKRLAKQVKERKQAAKMLAADGIKSSIDNNNNL